MSRLDEDDYRDGRTVADAASQLDDNKKLAVIAEMARIIMGEFGDRPEDIIKDYVFEVQQLVEDYGF